MAAVKEAATQLIADLPDEVSWEDIMRSLYVRQKIEAGLRDLDEGRVVSHDEIKKQFGA